MPTIARPAPMEASRAQSSAIGASCNEGRSHPALKVGGKDAADRVVFAARTEAAWMPPAMRELSAARMGRT